MRRRWLVSLLLVLVLILPQHIVLAGEMGKKEKVGEVTILRDSYGVPHLYAKNKQDLYEAYGYVMAKDRLFQLEMFRRGNEGTVSEIFGEAYLSKDLQTRRDGHTNEEVEAMLAKVEPKYEELIAQFAKGISRYVEEALHDPEEKLPKEFHDYDFLPREWTSTDVVRLFMASMTFFMDNHQELTNARLLEDLEETFGKEVARDMFDDLVWVDDPQAPTSIPTENKSKKRSSSKSMQTISSVATNVAKQLDKEREEYVQASEELGLPLSVGSNAIIVGADKSKTGNALLMSGPQVGFVAPGFLYEVGLHTPGYDMVGSSFIGYPFIMFGANNDFAFSSTAGYGNVVDLFEETIHPQDSTKYLYKGEWREMEKRTELINVKKDNGESEMIEEVFYRTVHGPVISIDEEQQIAYSKAWAFRGTEATSMAAFMEANFAKNRNQFEQAASKFTMSLNWYYVSKNGDIGYYHVGKYPIRNAQIDERIPTPGTGEYEWEGFLPFKENPQVVNPKNGYVVNWNNKPEATWSNGENSFYWGEDNRVQQFINGMEAREKVTLDDLNDINHHASFVALRTNKFKPLLIEALNNHKGSNANYGVLIEELENWNNLKEDTNKDGYYDAAIATFFDEWWNNVHDALFEDQLDGFSEITNPITNHRYGGSLAYRLLNEDETNYQWLEESPEQVIIASVEKALATLEEEKGQDVDSWKSEIKKMTFGHESLIAVPHSNGPAPSVIEMNRGSENHYIEMAPGGPVGFNITPPGQIGFVKKDGTISNYYTDQVEMYENWEFKPYLFKKKDVENAMIHSTKLQLN
ncbi:penicillin acylase family protein [Sporosarcina sp. ACRSM]|uniref:penicillin acylase family protein n=1 Tax=Sporosarcina sp. ACRSM TaxID=2918216 RepID=UPI001EF5F567|nr:penicillin acylase family protein [Sporosarcina sp. ACRSM]MCG7333707.1 penicillin acylase family protein [Sporosarcina sp. ACRSM]